MFVRLSKFARIEFAGGARDIILYIRRHVYYGKWPWNVLIVISAEHMYLLLQISKHTIIVKSNFGIYDIVFEVDEVISITCS